MDVVAESAPKPRRTKRRGRHPDKALSAAFVRSAPPGRHADGNGLYLFVQPSGTRSWVQRLVIRGRRRELGLGAVSLVPLAKAREKALDNRRLAHEGGNPLSEKRRADGVAADDETVRASDSARMKAKREHSVPRGLKQVLGFAPDARLRPYNRIAHGGSWFSIDRRPREQSVYT